MRFMTLVKSAENQGPPPPALMEAIGKLGEEAFKNGTMVEMGGLHGSASAARVRLAGGKLTVTDGPFTETKDQIGGMSLIECADLDEAIKVAAQIPGAWDGAVEVRPTIDFGG